MDIINNQNIIVTLYEGHYHIGVAALINSLVHIKFTGLVRIGYRGKLPAWTTQLTKQHNNSYIVNEGIEISFVQINTKLHFGYYKPKFIMDTLLIFPEAEYICYFDPDIVIHAKWSFISSWIDSGVALCLDSDFPFVHRNHPWRTEWVKLSDSTNLNHFDYFVNSGFIGIKSDNQIILKRWVSMIDNYQNSGGDLSKFNQDDASLAIKSDQDLLNAAITISPDLTFSIVGREGMGFAHPAYLMSHAVGVKPWKKNFIKNLFIYGQTPSISDVSYIKSANYPIKVFSKTSFTLMKVSLKTASILGRIFG